MILRLQHEFFDSTRGRIVTLLRAGGLTVDDIGSRLGLSHNAVRVQLIRMERDGLVRRTRVEPRTTRPSRVFELTPAAQQVLSKAYIPFLTELVHVIAARESAQAFEDLMRAAGRTLAARLRSSVVQTEPLDLRLAAVSGVLSEEFGTATTVERTDSKIIIHGHGCPLAALTGKHPAVCKAMETLVAELIDEPVTECCTRAQPPECCFETPAQRRQSADEP